MNIRGTIDAAISLAKVGAEVFPQLAGGVDLAEKTLDILDGLKSAAPGPVNSDADIEAAHKQLYDAMVVKGHVLSDRLRG